MNMEVVISLKFVYPQSRLHGVTPHKTAIQVLPLIPCWGTVIARFCKAKRRHADFKSFLRVTSPGMQCKTFCVVTGPWKQFTDRDGTVDWFYNWDWVGTRFSKSWDPPPPNKQVLARWRCRSRMARDIHYWRLFTCSLHKVSKVNA